MLSMRIVRFAVLVAITVGILFGPGGNVSATIIGSDGYFLDTDTGWYWYAGVDEFVNQDWETARANIENMTKGGMVWELASISDIKTLKDYYVPVDLISSGAMAFTTDDKSIWGWLSDDGSESGHKAIAGLLYDGVSPKVDSFNASDKHPAIGAFAVAKPANTPTTVR